MATSSHQELAWEDDHTHYLSQLYTLYCHEISWRNQLCEFGYHGYPDPRFENNGNVYMPDFLAVGNDGDVQHFSVLSFSDLDRSDDQVVTDEITSATEYEDISDNMVQEYLTPFDISVNIRSHHEIVILMSENTYDEYSSVVKSTIESNNLILWLISSNGSEKIWKEIGDHSNLDLDSQIQKHVETYPAGGDLLQFSRNTDRSVLQYEFVQRLVKHCSRERQRTFKFSEIDDVMTSVRPPILGHLPSAEREEYWKDFLYNLLNNLELVVQTESPNEYKWKRKKFQSEPRYRRKILEKVKEELNQR